MRTATTITTFGETVVHMPGFGLCRRIDFYDAWLYAQAELEIAFRAWAGGEPADRRALHGAYQAALDREDRAASVLAAALRVPAAQREG